MWNLWSANTPQRFWQFDPEPAEKIWGAAIKNAIVRLELALPTNDLDKILALILGEAQFEPNHWELGKVKRLYYELKPLLPQQIINLIKKTNAHLAKDGFRLNWPIENRYVKFQWEVVRQLLLMQDQSAASFRSFWPGNSTFAFALTHDIETEEGQKYAYRVAELEETLEYRSSFNFVPERYKLDFNLMRNLCSRGFEIGVHGLKHDGKLFRSYKTFKKRAQQINHYLHEFNAIGFRSPLMHRNPYWMQELDIEYDLSFFDTDPYEPLPGGCMSIWPFFIGKFIELPYTLAQDCTLGLVLDKNTPQVWLDKVEFIKKYHGMALLNTHPDYLSNPKIWGMYSDFLAAMKDTGNYWHALPKDISHWWRQRNKQQQRRNITLQDGQISII